MRTPRIAVLLDKAGVNLRRRPTAVILTARFIPIGRVAVNIVADATHLPHRQFLLLTGISGITWASYSVGVGLAASWWIKDNPLLGTALAIVAALRSGPRKLDT